MTALCAAVENGRGFIGRSGLHLEIIGHIVRTLRTVDLDFAETLVLLGKDLVKLPLFRDFNILGVSVDQRELIGTAATVERITADVRFE